MISIENTIRSYSGRRGCMCGCNGTYNEGARARKMAITSLTKDPEVRMNVWERKDGSIDGCIFVDTDTRSRVLFLNERGVNEARAMGIEEEV